jgi:hypothetical protein
MQVESCIKPDNQKARKPEKEENFNLSIKIVASTRRYGSAKAKHLRAIVTMIITTVFSERLKNQSNKSR